MEFYHASGHGFARKMRIQGSTPRPEMPFLTPSLLESSAVEAGAAIMNDSGKLEQVSVKHTPDDQLIAPLTGALSNWSFEPAQVDGKPVAPKILLGIRLAAR